MPLEYRWRPFCGGPKTVLGFSGSAQGPVSRTPWILPGSVPADPLPKLAPRTGPSLGRESAGTLTGKFQGVLETGPCADQENPKTHRCFMVFRSHSESSSVRAAMKPRVRPSVAPPAFPQAAPRPRPRRSRSGNWRTINGVVTKGCPAGIRPGSGNRFYSFFIS